MSPLATRFLMTLRTLVVINLVLGIIFWTSNAEGLTIVHILFGVVIAGLLVGLSVQLWSNGVSSTVTLLALLWSALAVVLGLVQKNLATGNAHWVVQVVHLLLGVGMLGLAEMMGGAARRRLAGRAT